MKELTLVQFPANANSGEGLAQNLAWLFYIDQVQHHLIPYCGCCVLSANVYSLEWSCLEDSAFYNYSVDDGGGTEVTGWDITWLKPDSLTGNRTRAAAVRAPNPSH